MSVLLWLLILHDCVAMVTLQYFFAAMVIILHDYVAMVVMFDGLCYVFIHYYLCYLSVVTILLHHP